MANLEDHPLVNLSRSSNQTYFDSNGVLQTAGNDSLPPSYEYNSATGLWEKKGWYIGEARENLITYSSNFDPNTATDYIYQTATYGGSLTSIINGENASKVIDDGIGNKYLYINSGVYSTGEIKNLWMIFEQGSSNLFAFMVRAGTNGSLFAEYNFSTDTSREVSATPGLINTEVYHKVINEQGPNGGRVVLLRLSWEAEASVDGDVRRFQIYPASLSNDNDVYTILHHFQIEDGRFNSPPIITSGSTVTRSATLADITDLSWYNQTEGTFVVEFGSGDNLLNRNIPDIINLTGISGIDFYRNSGQWRSFDGSSLVNLTSDELKVALAYTGTTRTIADKNNTSTQSMNGFSGISTLRFEDVNVYIKSLKYYPRRLSNSQLQQLTS